MVELSFYCCSYVRKAYWICSSAGYPWLLLRTHCRVVLCSFFSLDVSPCFLSVLLLSLLFRPKTLFIFKTLLDQLPCLFFIFLSSLTIIYVILALRLDFLLVTGAVLRLFLCTSASVSLCSSTFSDGLRLLFDLPDILERKEY